MGKTPLFCTFGVHKQDYTKIDVDPCEYVFIPFYARGRDTFTDDRNPITTDLIDLAVTAPRTSFGISNVITLIARTCIESLLQCRKNSEVLRDLTTTAGKNKVELYWTRKSIYHYAVFDIGVRDNETGQEKAIIDAAFSVLKELRNLQAALKRKYSRQPKPDRGFIVASFYLWPRTGIVSFTVFTENVVKLPLDGIIMLTHLIVDEHEAGLRCAISGVAPYDLPHNPVNILGMELSRVCEGGSREFTLALLNVRSLSAHALDVARDRVLGKVDLLWLTETWNNGTAAGSGCEGAVVRGYDAAACARAVATRRAGGVDVFLKRYLPFSEELRQQRQSSLLVLDRRVCPSEVLMTKVSRAKEWALKTSLAVSVSLCTRVYMPVRKTGINDPCVDHMRRPNTTAAFCTDPVGIYDSPTTIRFGHVTVKSMSRSTPPLVATFESNDTVGYKGPEPAGPSQEPTTEEQNRTSVVSPNVRPMTPPLQCSTRVRMRQGYLRDYVSSIP
ncbi:hypothetical protein HPB49_011472 [Dermacentor silvarum]|uniref:Uncharacterized protein n=1 Tax=Dermacentor silvarum TaxID=543639 RepID=A0ACB8D542_DERSI|nr:hypothetical protein HPB49_011472 [Dermacentor silvarum]